jgi:glycosyltransferase involved in cell wall biosynthesis
MKSVYKGDIMACKTKIAIPQTHPIQHFCPQFASYAKMPEIDLCVFFESDKGLKPYFDQNFKQEVNWSGIDLSGFNHKFLTNTDIVEELTAFNPDIVVIYGYTHSIQKIAYRYAVKYKKKILFVSDSELHQKKNPIKELFKRVILHRYFTRVDYCLSVGDSNEDVYRSFGVDNGRLVRMYFPIDINFFNQLLIKKKSIREEIRLKYAIPSDTVILTTIGKLVPWKRQIDIIHVLGELEKRGIKATAFIIGSGKDEEKLRRENTKNTTNKSVLTGFVQPEDMARYLCATDIYVHPAEVEPHSLAISEAIYCGCPVIISNRCGSYGPTDDVQPGRNGYVYQVGNIMNLADKIEFLTSHPSLLKEFSEASKNIGYNNQMLAHGGALKNVINVINTK